MTTFITVTGPAYWASYLINGDSSGMEPEELAQAEAWLAREKVCIFDVARDEDGEPCAPWFTWSFGVHAPECGVSGGDVVDYIAQPLSD